MAEGSGGGGPEPGSGSKPASTMESAGGRLRFRVELRPEETTIVSWKKLLREANISESGRPGQLNSGPSGEAQQQQPISQPMSPPLPAAAPSLKQPAENVQKDAQAQGQSGTNRLSSVIERIERMYAGNGSSDEEDSFMDNVPDDDEYDTEDSFIDDAELDDYFQVDNSAIKHNGFFVNRGKLERIEPPASTNSQPKKRRHKDLEKGKGGSDGGHNRTEKTGNKDKKVASFHQRISTQSVECEAASANAPEVSPTNRSAYNQPTTDLSALLFDGGISKDTNADEQRPEVPSSKQWIESNDQDASTQKSNIKSSHKAVSAQRKEGSSVRPKSTALEKAISELEKIVAESRPPSTEVQQDADNSSQAIKRRLPPEVKQKLAKVARIVQQTNDGKIPKDVINRLMSIVGHLVQVRTLKRNLKILGSSGLSAKQEKDDKIQKMKKEVEEMVKLRIPYIRSRAERQAENSNDIQGVTEENKVLKRKYKMDHVLENKICDLYDLYIERQEEDSGPPVRRLYEELVSFWPSGFIDTNGITHAIYRAKDRRRASTHQKDQEKVKKRKALSPKAERAMDVTQASHMHQKKPYLDSPDTRTSATSTGKPVPNATVTHATAHIPVTFANNPNLDKMRQEKAKEGVSTNPTDALPKKKVKKRPSADVVETQLRLGKLAVSQADERPKHRKQVAAAHSKQHPQPGVPPA